MYAFGDDVNPAPDSINVLEEIVVDYINEMVGRLCRCKTSLILVL